MSTRPTPRTDDATTASPRTDSTTDFATTGRNRASGERPWTDQCGRQFSYRNPARLRNLTDGENAAMQDGV